MDANFLSFLLSVLRSQLPWSEVFSYVFRPGGWAMPLGRTKLLHTSFKLLILQIF